MAMSALINEHHAALFRFCVSHLAKGKLKYRFKRFEYLLQQEVRCLPLTKSIGEIGLHLMSRFIEKKAPKQNIRNTINDILILACAFDAGLDLVTEDKVLNRFAASILGVGCAQQGRWLRLAFDRAQVRDRRLMRESKCYINRGWQVNENRGS